MIWLERFPDLTRHCAVLKESWKQQNAAETNAKPQSDHEFLPAALEIMEKPPSPGLRWLLLSAVRPVHDRADLVVRWQGRCRCNRQWQDHPVGQCQDHPAYRDRLCPRDPCTQRPACRGRPVAGRTGSHAGRGRRSAGGAGLMTAEVVAARNAALLRHMQGRQRAFRRAGRNTGRRCRSQGDLVRASIAEYEGERASLHPQRAEQRRRTGRIRRPKSASSAKRSR